MSIRDRQHWDARFRALPEQPFPAPDPLLFQYTPPAAGMEARALDLACGLGQNGLWLAEQGYSVDLLDISREGLRRAQAEARRRGLRRINFLQVDLDEAALRSEAYDVVCVFRYFERELFPRIRECVAPGGRVIYQTYTSGAQAVMPEISASFLASEGELAGLFADWTLLRSTESDIMAQVVAVKPVRASGLQS